MGFLGRFTFDGGPLLLSCTSSVVWKGAPPQLVPVVSVLKTILREGRIPYRSFYGGITVRLASELRNSCGRDAKSNIGRTLSFRVLVGDFTRACSFSDRESLISASSRRSRPSGCGDASGGCRSGKSDGADASRDLE